MFYLSILRTYVYSLAMNPIPIDGILYQAIPSCKGKTKGKIFAQQRSTTALLCYLNSLFYFFIGQDELFDSQLWNLSGPDISIFLKFATV